MRKKWLPLGTLYRRQNWVGFISLKIQGEMLAVESTSHRKMKGTKRYLEQLMRHRRLRSVKNSYGTREATFSCVEIKGTYGIYYSNIKTPYFYSNRRGKLKFWRVIVGTSINIYWALGLVRGDSVVREYINSKEDIRLWTSQASYDCKGWERWANEEYSLS